MSPIFVGISGGTGAGKSTLCYKLVDKYPDKIAVVHLDDYHKKRDQVPLLHSMTNWDHPEAINFELLLADLEKLMHGESIVVQSKDRRFNPKYNGKEFGRLPLEVKPKPIILIEGYLVLWHPKLRAHLDRSIYLDLEHKTRISRRDPTRLTGKGDYLEKVALPMHEQFVEPSKRYATTVIDVGHLSALEVLRQVETILNLK